MLNILSMTIGAQIITVRKNSATLQLTAPVCTAVAEKVVLSRRVGGHWRLIGWGEIEDGVALDVQTIPAEMFSQQGDSGIDNNIDLQCELVLLFFVLPFSL